MPVLRAPAPARLDLLRDAGPVRAPLPSLLRRLVFVFVGVAAAVGGHGRVHAGLGLVQALRPVILQEAVVGEVVSVLVDEREIELVARVSGDEIDLARFFRFVSFL